MEPLILCSHVNYTYHTLQGETPALCDIHFHVNEGEFVSIVGPSGCGKSTLGRTILNLLPATSGEVIFDGVHVENANKKQMSHLRQEMQIIFQDPFSSLNPRMTAVETIR